MGATPLGYLMTVSAPRGTPDAWFAAFAAGLAADQAEFGICSARRRHHLHPRPGQPVADHPRPCRAGRARCAAPARGAGDGALGHRHHRRRRARPAGRARRDRRSRRLPRRPLPPAAAAAGAGPGGGRHRRMPAWMCRTGWCRTPAISAAPAASAASSRPPRVPLSPAARAAGPAGAVPDRRRRLRTAARRAAGAREAALTEAAAAAGTPVTRIGDVPGRRAARDGPRLPMVRRCRSPSAGWSHFEGQGSALDPQGAGRPLDPAT